MPRYLKLLEKPFVLTRKGKVLFIFPSRPYWFSGNKVVYEILKILENKTEEKQLIKKASHFLNLSPESAANSVKAICNLLYKNLVLTINSKKNFKKKIYSPHFQVNRVENVLIIAATNAYNLRCPHCYASATRKLPRELTLKEIENIIDQVTKMPWEKKISQIGLTGGEIFTRDDALKIIEAVIKRGFRVFLSTNALLLDDEKIKRLSKLKGLEICVSLDGPDRLTHEFIRGKNTFKATVRAIKKLCAAGIPVGINMFIHRKNFNLIEKTLSLAASLEVSSFNCLSLMRVGRANSRSSSALLERVPEYTLYRKLFEILRKNKAYYQLMMNSTFANQLMRVSGGVKSSYCGVETNRALYVMPNGDLYPCPDTVVPSLFLGNLKTEEIKEIWKNSKTLKKLRKLRVDSMNEMCAQCEVRYFCGGGCRGENYQTTKSLTAPHFNCRDIKKSIYEIMWILTEEPDFYREKVNWLYQRVKNK